MNAKLCKKLRKEARKYSNPKLEDVEYTLTGTTRLFKGHVTLVPKCFRAVYQESKKLLKMGFNGLDVKNT